MGGGGSGAFIGRAAARLDNRYEVVAGALSSDPQKSGGALPIGTSTD